MDELLTTFATATATTLHEMAGVEAVTRAQSRATGSEELADVSVAIRLLADREGWLVLSFPQPTATALAGKVLAEAGGECDDRMIQDCASELANVIAGQAKTLLFGTPHHFTLSTPIVLTAASGDVKREFVIKFDSEVGPFTLYLCPPVASVGTNVSESLAGQGDR